MTIPNLGCGQRTANQHQRVAGAIVAKRSAQRCITRSTKIVGSLFATWTMMVILMNATWGQDASESTTRRDPIADGILQSYVSGFPKGMFFGRWQTRFGDQTNMENRSIMELDGSELSGEWKFAPRQFEWFHGEIDSDTKYILLRDQQEMWHFKSRKDNRGKIGKDGSIKPTTTSDEPFSFHDYRMWWPNFLIDVSIDKSSRWDLQRVEIRGDRTFIHFDFSVKGGYFELDMRDGFQVLRIFEECKNPRFGDFSHDWTFENQSIIVDGKKYWFPKSARFFFHLRTAGQNKKKELLAEFSSVGYSSIAMKPKVEFPDGTEVYDDFQKIRYKVGGDSVSMFDMEQLKRILSRPDVEAPPDLRGASNPTWIPRVLRWTAFLVALISGCAFGIYRFRRKSKNT